MLSQIPSNINTRYDFIPFANWDDSVKGSRPAPYKLKQTYPNDHTLWDKSESNIIGIRLNNLVLIDYDGNKENAIGEIPSVSELATALGFTSQQELIDTCLIQYNSEMTSLHFLFVAPSDFNTTDFKQSNQGTTEFFWKHIDIKTGNQLVYLKNTKTHILRDPTTYPPVPTVVLDQLRSTSTHVTNEAFDYTIKPSDHQVTLAEEWLHNALDEMVNTPDGNRNGTLNTLGCTVAGLVAGGTLNNQAAHTLMFEAAIKAGCEHSETINTLASAWEEGFKTPRRDAPYVKSSQTIEEVFASHVVPNTNINIQDDIDHTEAVESGEFDINDPNIGILHTQYKFFIDNWVMNKEGRFIDRNSLADFNKTAFNALHIDMMPVKTGSKSFKKHIASDVFEMANPTVVSDLMYMPSNEQIYNYEGKTYLNSYIPYEPERPSDHELTTMTQLIYNHLNWLFEDQAHQRYILDWMAWQVQRTGELVGWVPLVIGCLGDGKSSLFELVTAALGTRNTKTISNKSLNSDFQDWAVGGAVGAFEEIKMDPRKAKQVSNDLKPYISETRIPINGKGVKDRPMPNTMNYIAFTNEPDGVYVTIGDRRWLVLETRHYGKNNVIERTQTDMRKHFDDIKNAVNKPVFAPAVHHVLREHIISPEFENNLRFRAPQTVFSAMLNSQTLNEKESRLQEYLDNASFLDGRAGRIVDHIDGFQIQDFRPMMPDTWFQGLDKKPSAIMLGKWLRNLGYEHTTRTRIDGTQVKSYKKEV